RQASTIATSTTSSRSRSGPTCSSRPVPAGRIPRSSCRGPRSRRLVPKAPSATSRVARWSTSRRWSSCSYRVGSARPGSTCSTTSPTYRSNCSRSTASCCSRTRAARRVRRVPPWGGWCWTTSLHGQPAGRCRRRSEPRAGRSGTHSGSFGPLNRAEEGAAPGSALVVAGALFGCPLRRRRGNRGAGHQVAALGRVDRRLDVPVARARSPAQVAAGVRQSGALLAAMEQHPRELVERLAVDLALELDHRVERHPVVVPTPGVELRVIRRAQVDVAIATDQTHQEPDLLLSAVVAAPLAPHPVLGHVVAQPVAGATDDAHVLRTQPDFLVQLAVHRLFG